MEQVLKTKNVQILNKMDFLLLLDFYMTTINDPADFIHIQMI